MSEKDVQQTQAASGEAPRPSKTKKELPPPLAAEEVQHRRAYREYAVNSASAWHQAHLSTLYASWDEFNEAFFDSTLVDPYILLAEPATPQALGSCGPVSAFGGISQIRIRPSLLTGTYPHVRDGDTHAPGRLRVVTDVLLHEMIHQWQQEVLGEREQSYSGHGPIFRDKANRIGEKLGLSRVRTCKKRGSDLKLPSCSHWPHEVRPPEFYLGAYAPSFRFTDRALIDPAALSNASPATLRAAISKLQERLARHQAVPAATGAPR